MDVVAPGPLLNYTLAVCVECDGNAATLQKTVDQQEVAVGVLLLAEEGVDHRAGGIVHRDQQRERRHPVPQARVMSAAHWISMPSRGIRWQRTRCFGWRLRRGLLNLALTRIRRSVVLPMSMPSRSLSNSLRCEWLVPAYQVRAKCTTSAATASGIALVGLRPR